MRIILITLLAMLCDFSMCSVYATEAKLNPAQLNHLNEMINTQLKEQTDRNIVYSWTEAQRVAEFFCRPLAQTVIKKRLSTVDKVVLDQGNENEQRLISPTILEGNGQYRIGSDWTPFHFQCKISEKTGEAIEFNFFKRN
ncbi:hypothetical protein [Serratia sp. OS31]|uniref:hypothetical protein n=1 Tax=Serratia sp. OS31 TaxID=2760844 RepID=UPI001603A905|nr:hypothetical protein [Serratia sp. OS31]